MFSLYVFDLDGTLVDSRRDIAEAANALLEECGYVPLAEEAIGRMVGNGAPALVERAFTAAGGTPPPDALARYVALYESRLLRHTRAYPGVDEVLAGLAGRAPLAVLTNKPLAATRAVLEGLGLARYFDAEAVIGGDGPLPRKPDPAALVHLAGRAGTSLAATLLVGDSLVDWQTARRAGCGICLARYGFGFEGFPLERIAAGDLVIDEARALLEM